MGMGLGIIDEEALNIFVDGSCFPDQKRVAGVGVVLVWVDSKGDPILHEYCPPGWQRATINEMEIEACVTGLREASFKFGDLSFFKQIVLFTDSMYVRDN